MSRLAFFIVLSLVLAGSPARADEDAAERLFHEAYLQEVVHGKVAEAAETYLGLASDESLSTRLRAEARFRFAVCAALLGRADEARVWLGGILRDESLPATHRDRAKAYLESLATVGVGSELDKRLQDLVFQLGRADPGEDVPVYRDFEILGERAVPFLKQLLRHEDEALRQHAFRILCRMRVPGMGAAWDPSIPWTGLLKARDMYLYFNIGQHPEEVHALEQNLLGREIGERLAALRQMVSGAQNYHVTFSLSFLRELAKHDETKRLLFEFLPRAQEPDETWEQVQSWLYGDDQALADGAAWFVLNGKPIPPEPYATGCWPGVLRFVLASEAPVRLEERLVDAQPAAALVEALDAVVEAGEAHEGKPEWNPLRLGYADRLMKALRENPPAGDEVLRFESVYRRWLPVELRLAETEQEGLTNRLFRVSANLYFALDPLLRHLPADRSASLVSWLLTDALAGRGQTAQVVGALPLNEPEHIQAFLAAARCVDRGELGRVGNMLVGRVQATQSLEVGAAIVDALPDIVGTLDPDAAGRVLLETDRLASRLSPDRVVQSIAGVLLRANDITASNRKRIVNGLVYQRLAGQVDPAPRFAATVVVPAANTAWDRLDLEVRSIVVNAVAGLLGKMAKGEVWEAEGRETLAHLVSEHLEQLEGRSWETLALLPDLFPPQEWIPKIPLAHVGFAGVELPQPLRDEVARELVAEGAALAPSVLEFVRRYASEDVARELFDGLLRSLPIWVYAAIDRLGGKGQPASVEALEEALARLLEAEEPDLDRLARLAQHLAARRPSERLLPAATRLLRAGGSWARTGIALANQLGQEALIPDLVPLLTSYDREIRTAAKEAIDAIREIWQHGVR